MSFTGDANLGLPVTFSLPSRKVLSEIRDNEANVQKAER